jgi:hypothetical protein
MVKARQAFTIERAVGIPGLPMRRHIQELPYDILRNEFQMNEFLRSAQ